MSDPTLPTSKPDASTGDPDRSGADCDESAPETGQSTFESGESTPEPGQSASEPDRSTTPSYRSTTAAEHVHRARLYKLVSLAFDRPGEPLAAALRSETFAEQVRESATALDGATEAGTEGRDLADDATAVAEASPTESAGVDDLAADWAALFGFEAGGDVSQYQAAYAPGTLVTNTDLLADIAGFYAAFDLSTADDGSERVDHLCLELEYVSHLALQTAYLLRRGDDAGVEVVAGAQADFLEDPLGRWTGRYRDAVRADADAGFYPTLASLVETLVTADLDRFDRDPDPYPETPPAPLAERRDDEGDFRCGTCGVAPSPPTAPSERSPQDPT